MKIYLKQTDYKKYNDDGKYPLENIKKQYDIFVNQNMYFNTNNCRLYCCGDWISKYNFGDMQDLKKMLKKFTVNELIEYCTKWEFRGFIRSMQDYYKSGGKITGY